jgi:alkaline phosphatase
LNPSAVDVNIYASHPSHAPQLVGNHENTDIGAFIAEYLDLDLEPITQELKRKNVEMGNPHPTDADLALSGVRVSEWTIHRELSSAVEASKWAGRDMHYTDLKQRNSEAAEDGQG